MSSHPIVKKALIIAAGFGSRLKRGEEDLPKPLRRVAGLTLLDRIILTSKKAGITEIVIVVGHQKEKITAAYKKRNLGVKIDFVENPDWQKSNGISVLAAKPYLQENFILLMSDHVFESDTLEKLRQTPLGSNKALLAVDYKLKTIFDMDDATKVVVDNEGQIQKIGKELESFNAVDTGMFLCTPELFDALEGAKKNGDVSLSAGIGLFAAQGMMGTFDVREGFWQDVDTPGALKHAESVLFHKCRKSTDGVISRHFNRYISLFITRLLAKTPITANQFTALAFVVGILSGYYVAKGDYWNVLLGAFLFKWASILDGCDGELSKLKLSSSQFGQWLDTICDNLTYLLFFSGAVVGLLRQGYPHAYLMAVMMGVGVFMVFVVMFAYLVKNTDSGSLLAIQQDFQASAQKSWVRRLLSRLQFMVKRDFFALFFLFLAVIGSLPAIVGCVIFGTHVLWLVLVVTKFRSFTQKVEKPVHTF